MLPPLGPRLVALDDRVELAIGRGHVGLVERYVQCELAQCTAELVVQWKVCRFQLTVTL